MGIDSFFEDWRYGARILRRDPVLAIAATATLAIAIGANTTMFSLVNSVLLRPLPYPGSERIYWIREDVGKAASFDGGIGPDYYSMREQNRIFEDVAAYDTLTLNWSGTDKPEQLDAVQATASFFRVMGTRPMLGRYLAAGEEGAKAPPVAVVSYAFWRSRLGGDPHAVGRTLTLDGLGHTIIGVMPQGFDYPNGTQVWRPIPMDDADQRPISPARPMRVVYILARLRQGSTAQALQTEMGRLTHAVRLGYPKAFTNDGFSPVTIRALPLQQHLAGELRKALMVLSGAVGLVLLIACVNLANLLLARWSARQRDLAVRLAVGAGRGRIVRQMLAESMMLALPGGVAGAALACMVVAVLNAVKPMMLDRYPAITLDLSTLAFTFAVTVTTGVVFGMAPALAAARIDIQTALKSVGHLQSGGRTATRLRRALVAVELSISLVLLIGAGLLGRSFVKLARVDLGFPAGNLLTMTIKLVRANYATAERQMQFWEDVMTRVKQLPMVRGAAVAVKLPLAGLPVHGGNAFQVAGRSPLPMAQRPSADNTVVSRDFFATMGIPLKKGSGFEPGKRDQLLVNEAFVRKILDGGEAVGQRLLFGPDGRNVSTIIGVVGDTRGDSLGAEPEPMYYTCECAGTNPYLTRLRLVVRTTGDPRAAIHAVEGQVYAVDRNQPVTDVKTMEERVDAALAPQRFQLLLIGCFAGIALLLAAAGVYGVMSYLVTRRTREIGIRMAMGARPGDVVGLVMRESAGLLLAAAGLGSGGAWALTRYVKSMLYGVTALDAPSFVLAAVVLGTIVMAAAWGPARRAAEVDPMTALREE